jgi:membrane-bound ClpP family serine protease
MAKEKKESNNEMPLGRENYMLMAIGFVIIVIGFVLMAGGKSEDPAVFSEEIFSFRRITLAPMLVLFGFVFEIYAIMKKRPAEETKE